MGGGGGGWLWYSRWQAAAPVKGISPVCFNLELITLLSHFLFNLIILT